MFVKALLATILFTLSLGLNAQLIYKNQSSNDMYWTNVDLGLDIMRFSFSDTMTATGEASSTQATLETIEAFLAQDTNGWGWATDQQFVDIYNWFDTDLNANSWTAPQNEGTDLFFELNGFGPAFSNVNNNGYSSSGQQFWYGMIKTDSVSTIQLDPDAHLRNFLFNQYADGVEANCTHSSRCGKSYHAGDLTGRIFTSTSGSLGAETINDPFNNAALLVRIHVSEPKTVILFLTLILGLIIRTGYLRKT